MTEEGQLLTFGSGTEGKTGHGSSDSKRVPKRITKFLKEGEEINVKIGQVRLICLYLLICRPFFAFQNYK